MNQPAMTESAPGWGHLLATVFIVGQSLCTDCMSTQIPFTRGSGYLLDAALHCAGLQRKDVFITNVVHCHPPHNRASTEDEIRNCRPWLLSELILVRPALVVALGNDAHDELERVFMKAGKKKIPAKLFKVTHPAYFPRKGHRGGKDWCIKLAMEMEKYL